MSSFYEILAGGGPIPKPPRRLDDAQVAEIRRLYAGGGYRQVDLAEEYGISQPEVSRIVNRKRRSK